MPKLTQGPLNLYAVLAPDEATRLHFTSDQERRELMRYDTGWGKSYETRPRFFQSSGNTQDALRDSFLSAAIRSCLWADVLSAFRKCYTPRFRQIEARAGTIPCATPNSRV